MRKSLLASCAYVAFTVSARACDGGSSCVVTLSSSPVNTVSNYYVVTNGCCNANVVSPSDDTLASWAAKKAVESQQGTWWDLKKVKDLSREELDARSAKLDALVVWAKTLSNHIFGDAYCNWALARKSELATRRASLDQLDIALSLVKGLPTPPEGK